jgi:peptidoglycan hydrolase-like protein with peptidoglycan-binding domain
VQRRTTSKLLSGLLVLALANVSPVTSAGVICFSYRYAENLVRRVQEKLIEVGHARLAADGKWGPKTRTALERFQLQRGLPPTGDLDEFTFHELLGRDVPYEGIERVKNAAIPEQAYQQACGAHR